tara:strand:- start:642 stop:1415 length:774 start_codon:yes stop_codon:yes gene_type:complete
LSIYIKNISYFLDDKKILRNINLEIIPGEILTIIGPNGAGKSSLIKIVSGDINPSEGEVQYGNTPLSQISLEKRSFLRSVLSQSQNINFDFSVREIIEMGWINTKTSISNDNYMKLLSEVSEECFIENILNNKFKNLSGGEQKRVHLARTFFQLQNLHKFENNKYLILDEPLTNLDIFFEIKIMELIKKKARDGLGVLVILHDLNITQKFSDKVAILKEGELKFYGNTQSVLNSKNLSNVYGLDMKINQDPLFIKYF